MEKFSLNAQIVIVYLKLMKKNVTKIGQSIVFLGHTNVLNVKISANLIRAVEKISKLKSQGYKVLTFSIIYDIIYIENEKELLKLLSLQCARRQKWR